MRAAFAEREGYDMKKTNAIYRFLSAFMAVMMVFVMLPFGFAASGGDASPGLGDINGDGKINSTDYIMCKRAFLGTYALTAEQEESADINGNGKLDTTDYIMLKRHVLGTYTIGTIKTDLGLTVCAPSGGTLRVAQFADLHFGTEGLSYHNDKVARTEEYMKYVAETEKPDLIVCSGDNILATGVAGLKKFIALMESLKTPWTYIFGNHDAEYSYAGYSKKELSAYLAGCGAEYLLYEEGYTDADTNRYGNFTISVLDPNGSRLVGALVFMDAGLYSAAKSSYESITEGQISWYKSKIDSLQAVYKSQSGNANTVVPTVVFSHIQLPEFYTAYKEASSGGASEFVIRQDLASASVEEIKAGGPTDTNTGFFDVLVAKQSTKAYFVGHAHTFCWQVKKDGILLGFAPQTGFSKLFPDNDLARKTYIYNIASDFSVTTDVCVEDADDVGLAYCGTYDGVGAYDSASGTYIAAIDLALWNTVEFSFDGVRITVTNTAISGYFTSAASAPMNEYLYASDGKTLTYSSPLARTYIFTYDPTAKTLKVDIKPSTEPIDYSSFKPDSVNVDAGADKASVWTTAGTKIRSVTDAATGASFWAYYGWRYFVVIDAEGRVAYAVKYPANGYGAPSGTGYYANSCYSDYKTNPAFVFLSGYGQGGYTNNLYEVVIPEGGFALSAHGAGIATIVNALSGGTISDISDANINRRGVYSDDIRVSYDASTKTVTVTAVGG